MSASLKRRLGTVWDIIFRNTFLLINGITGSVVVLLVLFGDTQEGIFLGLISIVNIVIGCVQEINAWRTLERLQFLTAPKVTRVATDGVELIILIEEVQEKDVLKLKLGDQVPCDGVLLKSHGFEINEALITGESNAFLKKSGDEILAGSIITSGSGMMEVSKVFNESRIALMTKSIKKYSLDQSPIQRSINTLIKYVGYLLVTVILFVVGRGLLIHESTITIIQNIGALTSVLLPQGMILAATLVFSYGATHLYRRNILLQEVNATEKIGRIKNLCMDKTGTLTDNVFALEYIHIADGVDKGLVEKSIIAYIKSGGKSSQTIEAIEKVYTEVYDGTIICDLSFPSSRQFGAVKIKDEFGERVILAGAPDVFLPYLTRAEDKAWVQKYLDTEAVIGKRLICLAQSESMMLSEHLDGIKLQGLAIFTLSNNLREGVKEAVTFFQERGVIIRIISGDNPKTVVATATTAGVQGTEMVVIGSEMEGWSDVDYLKNVHQFRIFARIKPEQKEKIIVALKQDGFTAMIGDGANDALAIKKADLGIAMFDGAQATRQLAPVVLVRNSFADLPDGVRFADSVIQNIEIFASIFFNQTFVGFFFFMILTMFGYSFPFTPLNITFVNYFTVGLPGFFIFYWILQPVYKDTFKESKSFLRQVIPFALISAVPQAIIATFAYFSSLEHIKVHGPTSLVVVSIIILGVLFFMHTPMVYSGPTTKLQKKQLVLMIVVEIISVVIFINIKPIAAFYNLSVPSLHSVLELVPMIVLYAAIQYWITGKYFAKRITPVS